MKDSVTLDSSEVKMIIAKFLDIPETNISSLKYNFVVFDIKADEIKKKLEEK